MIELYTAEPRNAVELGKTAALTIWWWPLKTGGLWWRGQLSWNGSTSSSAWNMHFFKTGGLSWLWSLKTGFTVMSTGRLWKPVKLVSRDCCPMRDHLSWKITIFHQSSTVEFVARKPPILRNQIFHIGPSRRAPLTRAGTTLENPETGFLNLRLASSLPISFQMMSYLCSRWSPTYWEQPRNVWAWLGTLMYRNIGRDLFPNGFSVLMRVPVRGLWDMMSANFGSLSLM